MDMQGPGYNRYIMWLDLSNLQNGKRVAAHYMVSRTTKRNLAKLKSAEFGWPGEMLFDHPRSDLPPTYLVIDKRVPWLRIVKRFPRAFGMEVLVHTNDHKPKHIHVNFLDGSNPRKNRYKWASLVPLSDTPKRSNNEMKKLSDYVGKYKKEIQKKIDKVPWS